MWQKEAEKALKPGYACYSPLRPGKAGQDLEEQERSIMAGRARTGL